MSSTWSDDLVPGAPSWVASATDPPLAPGGGGTGGAGFSVGVAALVVVVLLGILAVPVASLARGAQSFWPKAWDARLLPITQRDETLRGLTFDHPVPVEFLSDSAFVKRLDADNAPSASDRAELDREAGTFRALGFIDGSVDLEKAATATSDAGVYAFYDFNRKEIVIRGTTLDVSHRVTLAHELTHVLQDQHFNLLNIEARAAKDDEETGGSADAVTALIEGDANHVQNAYLKGLSTAEQRTYALEQQQVDSSVNKGLADVPPFVSLVFGAPYEFGPSTISVLMTTGGNDAVNSALTGPTPTSALFVNPGLTDPPPPDLAEPALSASEQADGDPESFGAFELYLTLAMKIDPVQALTAADEVVGGRARGLRAGGSYCYRATVATRDAAGATLIAGLAHPWASSGTRRTVEEAGDSVTLTACDPGKRAPGAPKGRVAQAAALLDLRDAFTVSADQGSVGADTARCVSRLVISHLAPAEISRLDSNTAQPSTAELSALRSLAEQSALTCRRDPSTGLR